MHAAQISLTHTIHCKIVCFNFSLTVMLTTFASNLFHVSSKFVFRAALSPILFFPPSSESESSGDAVLIIPAPFCMRM